MIAPCMPHQRRDAAPAVVVALASYQSQRAAKKINDDCPGWHAWHSRESNQWIAHRCGDWDPGEANFGIDAEDEEDPGRRRLYAVNATTPELLVAEINWQAELDLAVDFPEWGVVSDDGGQWWARWEGPDDGWLRPVFCMPSPAGLAGSLRQYVAEMGEEPDPCPVWW